MAPQILLTNDDGIRAPGIEALPKAHTDTPFADTVWPIAPLTVQSATGHGITFSEPLMVSDANVSDTMQGLAVDGRPADCVKLALSTLWPGRFGADSRPDLCISGMNAGANCGVNVIYSGTVAAAIESAFLGVPSIAVSLHLGRGRVMWDVAAKHARRAIDRVIASGLLAEHSCININVPRCEEPIGEDEESRKRMLRERREAGLPTLDSAGMPEEGGDNDEPPIVVCPMNTHGIVDRFEPRESPMGAPYYWSASHGLDFPATDEGTDVERLFARCITVTPLTYDLTDHAMLDTWAKKLG